MNIDPMDTLPRSDDDAQLSTQPIRLSGMLGGSMVAALDFVTRSSLVARGESRLRRYYRISCEVMCCFVVGEHARLYWLASRTKRTILYPARA